MVFKGRNNNWLIIFQLKRKLKMKGQKKTNNQNRLKSLRTLSFLV